MNADRNLLFGILALQMDFIDRDQLVAAMSAWAVDKSQPLGSILFTQQALTADRRSLLEALVHEHLKQHRDNPQESLAAVSSIRSVRDELEKISDSELNISLDRVSIAQQNHDPYLTEVPSVGRFTSSGSRFRLLRPHARGGLGEVHVAEDCELHREVALKQIQSQHADDPSSRARFIVEAEITGRLEHPGIVPVYGVGTYADGRPYYAMRFIRGDSLHDAIERFHAPLADRGDLGARILQLRGLLGRFVDVCDAISYAHSRGILHRDLKPGNIMLGKYGETLVVDWGLAKSVDKSQVEGEATLDPTSGSGSAPTIFGQAVGTPAFMSPEQAAGRHDELSPASDVYSLGATLYCLLCGRVPFRNTDLGQILQDVQRGKFPPPREVNKEVPASLQAICLKAMSLSRADRYTSPRDLADDIEHYLADEPVVAQTESYAERAARWGRRHRAWTRSAMTAVAAMAIMFLVAFAREKQLGETAQSRLQESLYQQAQSLSLSGAPGWRSRSLAAIEQAAGIRQEERLRHVAAQSLFSWDWQSVGKCEFKGQVTAFVNHPFNHEVAAIVDGSIEIRRYGSNESLSVIENTRDSRFNCLNVSADGHWLICGDELGNMSVWSWESRQCTLSWDGQASSIYAVSFGPGPDLLTSTDLSTLRVWNRKTGELFCSTLLTPPEPPDLERVPPVPTSEPDVRRHQRFNGNAQLVTYLQPQPDSQREPRIEDLQKRQKEHLGLQLVVGTKAKFIAVSVPGELPRLWMLENSELVPQDAACGLPTGANCRLALCGDERYLILACNEPRWGYRRVPGPVPGGRIHETPNPAKKDPAPFRDNDRRDVFEVSMPIQSDGQCNDTSGESAPLQAVNALGVPDFDNPAVEPEQPVRPELSSGTTLSGVLSGPARKAYLYIYDIAQKQLIDFPIESVGAENNVVRLGAVVGLMAATDGNLIAVAGSQGGIAAYRLAPPELEPLSIWNADNQTALGAAMSANGHRLFLQRDANSIAVWEIAGGQHSTYLRGGDRDFSASLGWCKMVSAPENDLLALATWGKRVEVRHSQSGEKLATINEEFVRELQWTHDGRRLLAVTPPPLDPLENALGEFSILHVVGIDIHPLKNTIPSEIVFDIGFPVICMHLSRDDKLLAFGGPDRGVVIYRADSAGFTFQRMLPPEKTIVNVAFDHRGKLLACADLDGTVWVWNTENWHQAAKLTMPSRSPCLLKFSPDDRLLIAAPENGNIVCWQTMGWADRFDLQCGEGLLTICFSNDGEHCVVGDRSGHISLWHLATRSLALKWTANSTGVHHVSISSDPQRLISCGFNGEIRTWHLDTLRTSLRDLGLDW